MSISLLSAGTVALSTSVVGATPTPKAIPFQKGNSRFHVSWTANVTESSISGTLGKFSLKAEVTQPNPDASTFDVKGSLDGQKLVAVLVESVGTGGASLLTFTLKGSVGNRTLKATGALDDSGSLVVTFTGRIGTTKLSGKNTLTLGAVTSESGVVKVS